MPRFRARTAAIAIATLTLIGCSAMAGNQPESGLSPEVIDDPDFSASSGLSSGGDEGHGGDIDDVDIFAEEGDLEGAFLERDQFFEDQQVPPGEMLPAATTRAQKEFIDFQREFTIDKGGQWSDDAEQIALALTFDACETAILSSHDVDDFVLDSHLTASPLFQLLLEGYSGSEREDAETNLVIIMVHGTRFICPEDYDQWFDAAMELYPDYFKE